MLNIEAIPAFSDNYIWCISSTQQHKQAFVVDPGDAQAVIDFLHSKQLNLAGILITHWHADHIGGLAELHEQYNGQLQVYAPLSDKIPDAYVSQRLRNADSIKVFDQTFEILEVPGHTLDHIAYFNENMPCVFCGDALFSGGCGRIFEGNPEMMHHSLQRLAKLPKRTQVYCAHEYTLSNLEFALQVEPQNEQLKIRYNEVKNMRSNGKITLPSNIETELASNPFLRVSTTDVITSVLRQNPELAQLKVLNDWQVLGSLRTWKNNF